MEFAIYYTLGAIVLYFISDSILERIEIARGKRFEYRSQRHHPQTDTAPGEGHLRLLEINIHLA